CSQGQEGQEEGSKYSGARSRSTRSGCRSAQGQEEAREEARQEGVITKGLLPTWGGAAASKDVAASAVSTLLGAAFAAFGGWKRPFSLGSDEDSWRTEHRTVLQRSPLPSRSAFAFT